MKEKKGGRGKTSRGQILYIRRWCFGWQLLSVWPRVLPHSNATSLPFCRPSPSLPFPFTPTRHRFYF